VILDPLATPELSSWTGFLREAIAVAADRDGLRVAESALR